jgi:hypothetical protein
LKESVKRRKTGVVSKYSTWRLKKVDLQKSFSEKVQNKALERSKDEDIESARKELKAAVAERVVSWGAQIRVKI